MISTKKLKDVENALGIVFTETQRQYLQGEIKEFPEGRVPGKLFTRCVKQVLDVSRSIVLNKIKGPQGAIIKDTIVDIDRKLRNHGIQTTNIRGLKSGKVKAKLLKYKDKDDIRNADDIKYIAMLALRDEGWGKKRIERFNAKFNEHVNSINKGYIDIATIKKALLDELGLDFEK